MSFQLIFVGLTRVAPINPSTTIGRQLIYLCVMVKAMKDVGYLQSDKHVSSQCGLASLFTQHTILFNEINFKNFQ